MHDLLPMAFWAFMFVVSLIALERHNRYR